jgi:hypothetical protein
MGKIVKETMDTYICDGKEYYVLRTVTYNSESTESEDVKFAVFDSNFNKLAMQLGMRWREASSDRLKEFKEQDRDVFLGKASPISIICGQVHYNHNLDLYRAIWEKSTPEEIKKYKSLLGLSEEEFENAEANERIEEIENDGKAFYMYYPGTTFADEDDEGNSIDAENYDFLDDEFNVFLENVKISNAQERKNALREQGIDVIIGSRSPLIQAYDPMDKRECLLPNADTTKVGLWRRPTIQDAAHYKELLTKKKNKTLGVSLTPETK